METGEINRQPRGGARGSLGGGNPITADQLASAIASAQSVLGMAPPPPSPGKLFLFHCDLRLWFFYEGMKSEEIKNCII